MSNQNELIKQLNKLSLGQRMIISKSILTDMGFYTDNLWHIDDVKTVFECDDDKAMDILRNAMENDATMDHIWFAIRTAGIYLGVEEK